MSDLPEPLTPADCDLRGYDFMPLFGGRLFGSRLYTKALRNPRAGLAAIKLWWVAWQQCPAGSLPDDDEDLAMLADFGIDLDAWQAVREVALHGFVRCSDGRLYHPILCREALEAFERRKKERDRKARMRSKKDGTDDGSPGDGGEVRPRPVPRDSGGTTAGSGADTSRMSALTGQDRTGQKKEEDSEAAPLPPAAPTAAEPRDARTVLWSEGIPILNQLTGKPDRACRAVLGGLLRDLQDDCPVLLLVLQEAQAARPVDPMAWITKAVGNARGLARGWKGPASPNAIRDLGSALRDRMGEDTWATI